MKRNSLLLSLFAALIVSLAGCGSEQSEPPQPSEPITEEGAPEPGTEAQQPGEEGEVTAQGKQCWASCTVQNIGGGTCPATISGYGNTTFLGGCNKACNKAQGDAASKLPAGCVINTCSFSGC